MKKWLLSFFLLLLCVPAFAETFSGEVLGISMIRKVIFVQYVNPSGTREVAKLFWSDSLPQRRALENAEIGDKIQVEAAQDNKDQWLVRDVAGASTEAAPPAEELEPIPAPRARDAFSVEAAAPAPVAPKAVAYRELENKLASGEAKLLPAAVSESVAGPGAPVHTTTRKEFVYDDREYTRTGHRSPFGFIADSINGAALSVKGALDSTGRAVKEVLP